MNLRSLSGILGGGAVLLLLVLQILPWAKTEVPETTVPGFDSGFYSMPSMTVGGGTITAGTWGMEYEGEGGGDTDEGWYSSDMDDGDGVALIRVAIPLLLGGAALGLAAALVTLTTRGVLGPVLALASAVLLVVATVLFANGVDELFEGVDSTWLAGFYAACLAAASALAAGVVGLAGRNAEPMRASAPN